jgi:TonB family protein
MAAKEGVTQPERAASKEQARTAAHDTSGVTPRPVPPKEIKPQLRAVSSVQITVTESTAKSEPVTESLIISTPATSSMPDSGAVKGSMQSILSSALILDRPESNPAPPGPTPPTPSDLIPAVLISKVNPLYPPLALRASSSGTVVLEIDIDRQGNVVKARPVSGPEVFYPEAIKAVMKWRYRPASLRGTSVASTGGVSINFSIKR